MSSLTLAAWLNSYRRDLRAALTAAAEDRFSHIQANAASPNSELLDLSASGRRHLARTIDGLGLRLDGLGALFPGEGLADPARGAERIDALRRTLELSAALGIPDAVVTIGGFEDEKRLPLAREALEIAADLADRVGVRLAVQSPADDPLVIADRVREVACPKLRVGVDSATLENAADPAGRLTGVIGSVHLRDVRRVGERVEETPFGAGDVDFRELIGLLARSEYAGSLVVRSDNPSAPVDALRRGRDHLVSLLRGV